jgi:hypothetical protein
VRALVPFALLGLLAGPAAAEPLGGADLLRELSDQTLTGFNGALLFSEYHAPDGKVLGHNAGMPNQDSCWRVRGNAVCYYYPHLKQAGSDEGVESCWHFERAGPNGYKITPVGSTRSGIARLEPGNARQHSTNGAPSTPAVFSAAQTGPRRLNAARSP